MAEASSGSAWEFDGFTMLTEMRALLTQGVAVPLTSKAFDTLAILVANRDRVVTKDELLRSVWPDVVVEEDNLTQQIFSITWSPNGQGLSMAHDANRSDVVTLSR
jgi:DNA-binding winged helix-turn-helix (wHTH) protein